MILKIPNFAAVIFAAITAIAPLHVSAQAAFPNKPVVFQTSWGVWWRKR